MIVYITDGWRQMRWGLGEPFGGVSTNLLHGFGRFHVQKLSSLSGTGRVECPHTCVHVGGNHDAPYDGTPRHLHLSHPRGATCRRGAAGDESVLDRLAQSGLPPP